MRHKATNTNKAVMYGVMGMAVVVMLVVLMFLSWTGKSSATDDADADSTEVTTGSIENAPEPPAE